MKRTYRAKAALWDLGETGSGAEQVAVEFIILTEGADIDRITWFGYFTDKTWERTIESLRYMGWKGQDLSQLDGLDANEVDLVIDDETYEGKTRAKVQWVNRVGGLALKAPLSGDKRKAFAASMRDKIKTFDAASGQPKAKASSASRPAGQRPTMAQRAEDFGPPPINDDDIPF